MHQPVSFVEIVIIIYQFIPNINLNHNIFIINIFTLEFYSLSLTPAFSLWIQLWTAALPLLLNILLSTCLVYIAILFTTSPPPSSTPFCLCSIQNRLSMKTELTVAYHRLSTARWHTCGSSFCFNYTFQKEATT